MEYWTCEGLGGRALTRVGLSAGSSWGSELRLSFGFGFARVGTGLGLG